MILFKIVRIMKRLNATSLPIVLVISVLIMILILMAFEFWNINSFYYMRYHIHKQQKLNLSSVLTIFCSDSMLSEQMKIEKKYQLYDEDDRSIVYVDSYLWGLYECISLKNFDKSICDVYLLGKSLDTNYSPALWICDRDHSISLSGKAEISGKIYLPKNGINYINLNFDSYRGDIISSTNIYVSSKDLPLVDSAYLQSMWDLKQALTPMVYSIPSYYYSFSNDPLFKQITDEEEILYAKGRLILYGDRVYLKASCKVSDIILIARSVTIESGFNGALQIMASDTVEIENGAYLHYPSGIYIHGNRNKAYLHVGSDSHIEGYAIVEGNVEGGNGFIADIHYRQDKGSQLMGLLFVDGIAHLEGTVIGAAYLKDCCYLSGENMYHGLIYNGKVIRNDNISFPFLFLNDKLHKKKIKKIE